MVSQEIVATQQPYLDMIRDCELRSRWLTEWEVALIQNIKKEITNGVVLSYGRVGMLEEIWEKANMKLTCTEMARDSLKYGRYANKEEQELLYSMLETLEKGNFPKIGDMVELYDTHSRPNDFTSNDQDWGF